MLSNPFSSPRAHGGRAPDVFRKGAWVPMREHRETDEVDFAIVGTGAGGGTLAALLAEQGFSVVAFDAGPYFRPLEDFASDETAQSQLFWTDHRIVDGESGAGDAAVEVTAQPAGPAGVGVDRGCEDDPFACPRGKRHLLPDRRFVGFEQVPAR